MITRERPEVPPWFWPLLVYAGLTLVAAAFSLDRMRSLGPVRQMFLYLVVPAVCSIARGKRAHTLMTVIITVGAVSAIVGVIEYGVLNYDSLSQRPRGTLGHYMTYSGLLMIVICATAARLLYSRRDWIWPALVMPALVVALALDLHPKRLGWGVRRRRPAPAPPRPAPVRACCRSSPRCSSPLAPAALTDRAYSMFNLNDPTNRDRLAMVQAGTSIIKHYPLTGVGPKRHPRDLPDLPHGRGRRADGAAPAQRAAADCGRARPAGAGGVAAGSS